MVSDWGLSVTILGVMCVVGVSLWCGWVLGGELLLVVVVVLFFTRGNCFWGGGEMILLLTYTVQRVVITN